MKILSTMAVILLVGLLFTGYSFSLASPATPTPRPEATEEAVEPVRLHYFGNSSFFFVAPDGTRVVIDPFSQMAYPFPEGIEADVVTVSHNNHADHNNVSAIEGDPIVLDGLLEKPKQFGMVEISTYEVPHPGGGDNLVFIYQIGDVKLVHLGDTYPIREPEIMEAIEGVDVLLAPEWVIVPMMRWVESRTIVPMHYGFEDIPDGQTLLTVFLSSLPPDVTVMEDVAELEIIPDMPAQIVTMPRWTPKG